MKFKLTKAAWNDGVLGMSMIAFAVMTVFLMLQVSGVFPAEAIHNWIMAGLMTLMAVLFLWRLTWILRLFRNGTIVGGIVDKVSVYRDRGVVTFFFVKGETFVKTRQPIMWNKTTKTLSPGLKVQIIYDEKKLKRALIASLYQE
jgi:hypothetical protein